MGHVTTLEDIAALLDKLDQSHTIYAARLWLLESSAIVEYEPDEGGGLSAEVRKHGLTYFLDVAIAKEFMDGWVSVGLGAKTGQRCAED